MAYSRRRTYRSTAGRRTAAPRSYRSTGRRRTARVASRRPAQQVVRLVLEQAAPSAFSPANLPFMQPARALKRSKF